MRSFETFFFIKVVSFYLLPHAKDLTAKLLYLKSLAKCLRRRGNRVANPTILKTNL